MSYWKQLEKRTAQAVGGERTSQPYANLPDVITDWLVIECKARKTLPQWIVGAVEQAAGYANASQLPIVRLHEKGRHAKNDLVVMRWGDFEDFFGEVREMREDGGS